MLLTIRFCEGYGWHVGRPIVWVGLLALGIPLALLGVFLDTMIMAFAHLQVPIALVIPLLFLLVFYLRLKRKLNGRPFAVCLPEFLMDDMTTLMIPRGHKHFRALAMLEFFIWGSVIASQLGIIGTFHLHQRVHQQASNHRPLIQASHSR